MADYKGHKKNARHYVPTMLCRGCGTTLEIRAANKVAKSIACACGTAHQLLICSHCERLLALPNQANELRAEVRCPRQDCKTVNNL